MSETWNVVVGPSANNGGQEVDRPMGQQQLARGAANEPRSRPSLDTAIEAIQRLEEEVAAEAKRLDEERAALLEAFEHKQALIQRLEEALQSVTAANGPVKWVELLDLQVRLDERERELDDRERRLEEREGMVAENEAVVGAVQEEMCERERRLEVLEALAEERDVFTASSQWTSQ